MYTIVEWTKKGVVMIDQRVLPDKEVYNTYTDYRGVAKAIKDMVVRGAPAIGVAAAFGCAIGAKNIKAKNYSAFKRSFGTVTKVLAATRPTAINLFWAIERMKGVAEANSMRPVPEIKEALITEAIKIHDEDIEINRRIGSNGGKLLKSGTTILTHCNAGALATAGYGTALGVIRGAVEAGKKISVLADETRPFLQGARLTAWELMKDNIDVTLITDNMSGHLMGEGLIDGVVVGSDRIASNGDVCNKIGTYMVAVLAKRHGIPFYVAAPTSTIDMNIRSGREIPIEERPITEVTHIKNKAVAPKGVKVRNPAFDVTPANLVTAIITEKGVAKAPYRSSIKALFKKG